MIMLRLKYFILLFIAIGCLGCLNQKSQQTKNMMSCLSISCDTIYEPGYDHPLLKNLKILYNDSLVYQDNFTLFESGNEQKILFNDSIIYILIKDSDPITAKTLHVLRCTNKKVVSPIVTEGLMVRDIDDDCLIEIVGQEFLEAVCIQCDSDYYSPIHVYKLGIYCTYDENLSRELTTIKYGCYLGKECKDTILLANTIQYNNITLW